jgi:DNA topoisomerase-1
MVLKSGRYGPFFSCAGYPECKTIRKLSGGKASSSKPTGVKCPKCTEGEMVERMSRRGVFYSCSRYPKCDFTLNKRPIAKSCPDCNAPYLLEKETKREGHQEVCNNAECGYKGPFSGDPQTTDTTAANE